jgi:hypothetical protein
VSPPNCPPAGGNLGEAMNDKHLEIELRRLQSENAKLRAALKQNGRHARRIMRAHDVALLLAHWHIAYLPTTRDFAMAHGCAQRQWQNAMALLKLAHVVDAAGRWLCHDLPTISARLDDAVIAANAAPEIYFGYGPAGMQA